VQACSSAFIKQQGEPFIMTNATSRFLHLLFIALLLLSAPVLAAETEAPTNITLKLPELKLSDELEQEVSHFDFDAALAEVHMDDDAAYVVSQINQAISELQDLAADVELVEIRGERQEVVALKFSASLAHKVIRMEFSKPSALKGQIYVADQKAMEVRMYLPVSNQIAVQRIENISNEAASALNVTDLDINTLFDFSRYEVALVDSIEDSGVVTYTLRLSGFENQVQYVEVRSDTFIPHKVVVCENDTVVGSVTFANVVLDQNLSAETITKLPAAKEVRL
jgi:outer membrane lipoprotein-sorting protein